MQIKKVAVIGHFAFGLEYLDGQTVKTKILTQALCDHFGENEVLKADTHGWSQNPLKFMRKVWKTVSKAENIVILPAHNGLRVNAPLLAFQKLFFRSRKLHYVVIGGWLPVFLQKRKWLSEILKSFDGIYVETNTMRRALEAQGFRNVLVMPNSKNLKVLNKEELVYPDGEPYRLCTFSRVMKEKGIGDAAEAVRSVNEKLGRAVYTLDIYGQIDANQKEWFEELKKNFPPYVHYCGLVPFDQSTDVLKNYFALLFPTYYDGEGFAGTLIDAFSAGIPVIASDWRYNSEIVNKKCGYVYPTGDRNEFHSLLEQIAINPSLLIEKKKDALKETEKYKIDKVIRILINNFH